MLRFSGIRIGHDVSWLVEQVVCLFMYMRLLASFAESSWSDSRKESDRVKLVAGVLASTIMHGVSLS